MKDDPPISLSIDLLKLQGAELKVSPSGRSAVVIYLDDGKGQPAPSRIKLYRGKGDQPPSAYLRLRAFGANCQREDTHCIAEATSSEEREARVKLPIIGNARLFSHEGPARSAPPPQRVSDEVPWTEGDEIAW
jgi:hypothetical protein